VFERMWQGLSTIILSLILATLVWFVAMREENPPVESDYGPAIPLEIENIPAEVVIFDSDSVPSSVSLHLRAPQTSWDQLSPGKFRAWIDLTDLPPGLHDVPVQVEVSDRSVTVVDKSPSTVNVRLESLAEAQVPIRVNVMDNAPVGYIARVATISSITATVSGPATVVDQVTQATADIYLRNAKETVKRSVDLSARDANGDAVNRVTLNPNEIEVTIPIEQRFGYRDVSVRVPVSGEVAPGYWVSNINVDPATVTVVGGPSALQQLPGFIETFPIDVSDATSDITERVAFALPPGVSVVQPDSNISGDNGGAQVQVQIAAVEGGQTVQRTVTLQGLDQNRSAVARPQRVDVILSGPLPRLQALTLQDVKVIADLFGLGLGVHKVKPTIVVPETLRVESVLPDTIEIQISMAPPTPTSTATLVPTITPTQAITTTPTLTLTVTRAP
jgi:YbbR domain-containing protein